MILFEILSMDLVPWILYPHNYLRFCTNDFQSTANSSDSTMSLVISVGNSLVSGISKSHSIMFDIQAHTEITSLEIIGMDIYLDTSFAAHYEVWTKKGSWKNANGKYSQNSYDFFEIAHGIIIGTGVCHAARKENCIFATIPKDEFETVTILGGERQSFFVTLTTDDLVSQDQEHSQHKLEDVMCFSSHLDVFYGASVLAYPLELADPETDFRYGRGFIGKIWYQVTTVTDGLNDLVPIDEVFTATQVPTLQPSVSLEGFGRTMRRSFFRLSFVMNLTIFT